MYQGLLYFGVMVTLIFGGVFVLRWTLHGELLLDQLIGCTVGLAALVTGFVLKHRNRQHEM
ncbi:hypothetical protein [Ectobacillus ponti]|uniref:hypothetical protein n=1 Tax=Ectobacillus ponti TaxID=2961894 RepID=UPI003F6737CF